MDDRDKIVGTAWPFFWEHQKPLRGRELAGFRWGREIGRSESCSFQAEGNGLSESSASSFRPAPAASDIAGSIAVEIREPATAHDVGRNDGPRRVDQNADQNRATHAPGAGKSGIGRLGSFRFFAGSSPLADSAPGPTAGTGGRPCGGRARCWSAVTVTVAAGRGSGRWRARTFRYRFRLGHPLDGHEIRRVRHFKNFLQRHVLRDFLNGCCLRVFRRRFLLRRRLRCGISLQ